MKLSRVGKIRSQISNNRKGSINLHRLDFSKPTVNLASPFFLTQDDISHVYNAHVLCEYWNPACHFQDFYDINWSLFPNWLSHYWLVILMRLFFPLLADFFYLLMSSVSRLLYPIPINRFNADKLGLSTWLSFFIYSYLF